MFKRGIDTYAKHVCWRRRDGSQSIPLFVLFVLFGQAKRTLKEKYHKVTFPLSYFCMTKRMVRGGEATSERRRRDGVYQKSSKRAFTPVSATPTNALRALVNSPLFEISSRVHELVARSSAWQVRATNGKAKVGSLTLPRNLNYTTRANISHEEAEQIRARIVCTPTEKWVAGVNLICALTGWSKKFQFLVDVAITDTAVTIIP